MTIKQIEYFLAVASNLSFTAGAKQCYTSQPNLSRQIQKIEDEFNIKLFIKDEGKIKLSEAGLLLKEKGSKLLAQYKELADALSNTGNRPTITFGYISEYPAINNLMAYAGNCFDGYNLNWVHGGVSWLLESGTIDICFTFEKKSAPSEKFIKLFDVPIYAVVPHSLLPNCERLDMQSLEKYPLMLSYEQISNKCKNFFSENSLNVNSIEYSYVVFDVDSYLNKLSREKRIGFLPCDNRNYTSLGFSMVRIDGMNETIPLGIRWADRNVSACREIANKLKKVYEKGF